jgi:lipopolysaccharide transport system permease protein
MTRVRMAADHGGIAVESRSREAAETVYLPASQLRDPGRLLRSMFRDLAGSRELAWRLLVRNVSARYRQTLLGYAWVLLPPIVSTAVFVFLRRSGVFGVGEPGVPYAVYVLAGMVLWLTFADAVNSPMQMMAQSRSMLTKLNFPREALILAGVGELLFTALVRFALLGVVMLWFGVGLAASALLVPFGVLVLVSVALGLGVLLTPVALLYRDVEQGLAILLTLWMFVTPVLYPPPTTWPGSLTMALNPVSPVLDTTRAWLLGGAPQHLDGFLLVGAGSALLLFGAWVLLRLALPVLIERLGA